MGVGNDKGKYIVLTAGDNGGLIAVKLRLGHTVGIVLALLTLRQILPAHRQVVAAGKCRDGLGVHRGEGIAVIGSLEVERHIAAQAVCVIRIVPHLGCNHGDHRVGGVFKEVRDLGAVLVGNGTTDGVGIDSIHSAISERDAIVVADNAVQTGVILHRL